MIEIFKELKNIFSDGIKAVKRELIGIIKYFYGE